MVLALERKCAPILSIVARKHLGDAKPDVLFMCFGMADSFAGQAGLPEFTKTLLGSKPVSGFSIVKRAA